MRNWRNQRLLVVRRRWIQGVPLSAYRWTCWSSYTACCRQEKRVTLHLCNLSRMQACCKWIMRAKRWMESSNVYASHSHITAVTCTNHEGKKQDSDVCAYVAYISVFNPLCADGLRTPCCYACEAPARACPSTPHLRPAVCGMGRLRHRCQPVWSHLPWEILFVL